MPTSRAAESAGRRDGPVDVPEARPNEIIDAEDGETILALSCLILTDKNVQGAPALVVEILSPSTRKRDEQLKHRLYERTGVREYWLVNPDRDTVIIFRRAADGSFPQVEEATAQGDDTLTTPLVPGWSLALARLLR